MDMTCEELIKSLYTARRDAALARNIFIAKATEIGRCQGEPCYAKHANNVKEWCDICKTKQPLWEDWHKKNTRAAVALRAILRAGQNITKEGK